MSVGVLGRWLLGQSITWLVVLGVLAVASVRGAAGPSWLWFEIGLLLVSYAWLWRALAPRGTVADVVTAARFGGLLVALAWIANVGEVHWGAWTLLLLVVLADLVDGWCARRFGGSEQGALLDMETDQFATLALATLATAFAGAGVWCLLLPALKYVFALAMTLARVPAQEPKPQNGNNLRGKTICATVLGLLLFCVAPASLGIPQLARQAASLTALALLLYSFSADARFLLSRAVGTPTVD